MVLVLGLMLGAKPYVLEADKSGVGRDRFPIYDIWWRNICANEADGIIRMELLSFYLAS